MDWICVAGIALSLDVVVIAIVLWIVSESQVRDEYDDEDDFHLDTFA